MKATLRLATPADAVACLAIYAPFVTSTWVTFELEVPTPQEFTQRIEKTLAYTPWIVACEGEKVVGFSYASPIKDRPAYQWSVETAIYLAETARGQGLGKVLYEGLFRVLRGQGFANVFGLIALPNPGSIALHESFGFKQVAYLENVGFKMGDWRDIVWWQMPLSELPPNPAPPRPLAKCRAEAEAWLASR